MNKSLIIIFIGFFAISANSQWIQIPGPNTITTTFLISVNNTIIAGSGGYGIFRSIDEGNTWVNSSNGLNTPTEKQCFSIVQFNNDLIVSTSGGIFKSTDSGLNWVKINSNNNIYFVMFKNGSDIFSSDGTSVFKSTDEGINWISAGLDNQYVSSFTSLNGYIFIGSKVITSKVQRSSDGGISWESISAGFLSNEDVFKLYTTGNTLFACCHNNLYATTDNGLNWESRTNGIPVVGGTGYFIMDIIQQNGLLYITLIDAIYVSVDNGLNWTKLPLMNPYVTTKILFGFNNSLFAGCSNSIFRSDDNGTTWKYIYQGLVPTSPLLDITGDVMIAVSPSSNQGVFRSTDKGSKWDCQANFSSFALYSSDNLILVSDQFRRIYLSNNYGKDWTKTNFDDTRGNRVLSFASNNSYIFAGSESNVGGPRGYVIRSSNHGKDWEYVTVNLRNSVRSVAVINNNVFAAFSGGIYKSTDNGSSWDSITVPSLPRISFRTLAVDNGILYAGSFVSGLYKTTDLGLNWTSLNNNLPDLSINIAAAKNGNVIVSTASGIFGTSNSGNSWVNFQGGLPSANVTDLKMDDSVLYAGIASAGIWKNKYIETIVSVSQNTVPELFYLLNNYPNPFNPVTKISFTLPKDEFTNIEIFDINGRLITTLINENLLKGKYTLNWNSAGYASGVYFCRFSAGNYNGSLKMVLTK